MGSRVSSHRNTSDSVMKLRLSFRSKSHKSKPAAVDAALINQFGLKSQCSPSTFRGFGTKEELFFDSQPWLDSDCEDDFFSVNGDFTPSRVNTPVHQKSSIETPRLSKAALEDRNPGSTSEPSQSKKRLSELFQDSVGDDLDVDNQITVDNKNTANAKTKVSSTLLDLPAKSPYSTTSYLSGTNSMCSSERTPIRDSIIGVEKPIRSMRCCLPSLVSCHSFRERKKKMSPAAI